MKIYPDGTLEGTAEELVMYQRELNGGRVKNSTNATSSPLLADATSGDLVDMLRINGDVISIEITDNCEMTLTARDDTKPFARTVEDRSTILIVKNDQ